MRPQLTGRWTKVDPDYGACDVFGANRYLVAAAALFSVVVLLLALGLVVLTLDGGGDRNAALTDVAAAVVADLIGWLFVAYLLHTCLLVGERGFRYVQPLASIMGPIEGWWQQVLAVEMAYSTQHHARIEVSVRPGRDGDDIHMIVETSMAFGAPEEEICARMNARLAAFRRRSAIEPAAQVG
ncbi:MAG: hypothetical protein ACHQ01_10900 [Candidatus Limnocylindrales bacterium]